MARPRGFDADEAVERAKDLFWSRGYHATSVAHLAQELGLGAGSLYAAFGSKEGLYERALAHYCEQEVGGLLAALEGDEPIRTRLRRLLLGLVEMDLADPRGCFVVNAVTERDDHAATRERVSQVFAGLESALTGALERAKASGELGPDRDPAALARFLLTFIQGLRVVGQVRLGRAFAESAVESALGVLD